MPSSPCSRPCCRLLSACAVAMAMARVGFGNFGPKFFRFMCAASELKRHSMHAAQQRIKAVILAS